MRVHVAVSLVVLLVVGLRYVHDVRLAVTAALRAGNTVVLSEFLTHAASFRFVPMYVPRNAPTAATQTMLWSSTYAVMTKALRT